MRRVLVGSWAMVQDSASTSKVKDAAALKPSGQVMGCRGSAMAGWFTGNPFGGRSAPAWFYGMVSLEGGKDGRAFRAFALCFRSGCGVRGGFRLLRGARLEGEVADVLARAEDGVHPGAGQAAASCRRRRTAGRFRPASASPARSSAPA